MKTFTADDGTMIEVADFEFGFTFDKKAITVADEDGDITIEGYASDFEVDRQDEAFEPGAFDDGLKAFMDTNPVLLYHHKYDTAVGHVEEAKIDDKGLWVKAIVEKPEPGTPIADIYRKVKSGTIRGFSVGGKFFRRMTEKGSRIFKCDMRELSITPMPVNPRTLFAVAGKAFETVSDTDTKIEEPGAAQLAAMMERLANVGKAFDAIEARKLTGEGKASQHPDGPKIAALQYHLQEIHTLAENTKNGSKDEKVQSTAADISKDVTKHLKNVHDVAKKIGPLPNTYGGTYL